MAKSKVPSDFVKVFNDSTKSAKALPSSCQLDTTLKSISAPNEERVGEIFLLKTLTKELLSNSEALILSITSYIISPEILVISISTPLSKVSEYFFIVSIQSINLLTSPLLFSLSFHWIEFKSFGKTNPYSLTPASSITLESNFWIFKFFLVFELPSILYSGFSILLSVTPNNNVWSFSKSIAFNLSVTEELESRFLIELDNSKATGNKSSKLISSVLISLDVFKSKLKSLILSPTMFWLAKSEFFNTFSITEGNSEQTKSDFEATVIIFFKSSTVASFPRSIVPPFDVSIFSLSIKSGTKSIKIHTSSAHFPFV